MQLVDRVMALGAAIRYAAPARGADIWQRHSAVPPSISMQ
jgi:hypothetical protein